MGVTIINPGTSGIGGASPVDSVVFQNLTFSGFNGGQSTNLISYWGSLTYLELTDVEIT